MNNLKNAIVCRTIEDLPFQVLNTFGTAKERGMQHGLFFKNLIMENIEKTRSILLEIRKTTESELKKMAGEFYNSLKIYDKDALEEMEGIAEGANVPLEDILLINYKPELMNPFCKMILGCTIVLNKTERIFQVGQTFDWFQNCKDINVVIHYHTNYSEGIMICEAGCIGGIGLNNRGLIVLLNYLNNYYSQYDGCGYNCLLRRALLSGDLHDCERELLRSPIAFGLNLFLASWEGKCRDYELTAKGTDFFLLDDADIQYVHTNHYLSDKLRTRMVNRNIVMESNERYLFAMKCLQVFKNRSDGIEQCFKQHNKGNGDICRHSSEGVETLYSVIVDIHEKKLVILNCLPCQEKKYEISFAQLFDCLEKE